MNHEDNKNDFPIGRLIWAAFIGGTVTAGKFLSQFAGSTELFSSSTTDRYWLTFFLGAVVQCCFSLIPIFIAYKKRSKHRNAIYNLSTIFPILLLVISALVWSICDKPEPERPNKKEKSNNTIN